MHNLLAPWHLALDATLLIGFFHADKKKSIAMAIPIAKPIAQLRQSI